MMHGGKIPVTAIVGSVGIYLWSTHPPRLTSISANSGRNGNPDRPDRRSAVWKPAM